MQNKDLLRQFGARIRALRLEKKLSQEELSYKTGFHRTYIGMVERGERNISLSNIGVFAKVFNITLSELFNLPAHRGEEVSAEVIDGKQSIVFDEAICRLYIARALLVKLILG